MQFSSGFWRYFDVLPLVLIGNAGVVLSLALFLGILWTRRPEAFGHYLKPSIVVLVPAIPTAASLLVSIPGPLLPPSELSRFLMAFISIFPIPMTLTLFGKFFASEASAHDHRFNWMFPAAVAAAITLMAGSFFAEYMATPTIGRDELITWSLILCGFAFGGGWLVDRLPGLSFPQGQSPDVELAAPSSTDSTAPTADFRSSISTGEEYENVLNMQARTIASTAAPQKPPPTIPEPPVAMPPVEATGSISGDSTLPVVPLEVAAPTESLKISVPESPGAITALPATIPATPAGAYPVPEIPSASPVETIQLKLKRSQRSSVMGAVIFTVDARVSLPHADLELVRKYRLGSIIVYDSKARTASAEALTEHLKGVRDEGFAGLRSDKPVNSIGKSLYRLARASASATMMALALRITIESLIKGVHIECKSLGELIEAENAICESAEFIKKYLSLASTFDGREEIVEI